VDSEGYGLKSIVACRIVECDPTYRLITNNCQNFVKYLIESICNYGTKLRPETIQEVIERIEKQSQRRLDHLPGSYPRSKVTSTTGSVYYTAEDMSFHTARSCFSHMDSLTPTNCLLLTLLVDNYK
jgi:hypothetical protein